MNIRYSDYCKITYNYLKDNSQHGFAIIGESKYNIVHHNTFIDNSKVSMYTIDGTRTGEISSQGIDEGEENFWYDDKAKHGNIWSDFSGEGVYEIDGPANAVDMYPQKIDGETEETVFLVLPMIIILFTQYFFRRKRTN
jgi:parallel beta-helix repeat protein